MLWAIVCVSNTKHHSTWSSINVNSNFARHFWLTYSSFSYISTICTVITNTHTHMAQWCCTYVSNALPIFRPCPLPCVPNQIPQNIEVVMGILRLWVIGVWAVTSSRRARGGVWAGTAAYVSQYFAHHHCILPWTHNRALCVFRDPSGYLFLLKYQIDMIVLVWGGKSKQSITLQWSLDSQSSTFFIIASTKRAVYNGCSAYLYVNFSLLAAKVD